jgi:hypothetical protein
MPSTASFRQTGLDASGERIAAAAWRTEGVLELGQQLVLTVSVFPVSARL